MKELWKVWANLPEGMRLHVLRIVISPANQGEDVNTLIEEALAKGEDY